MSVKPTQRVLVAMSGGVDSSVAAALLVEQGYEVIGVTMQVWDYSEDTCEVEEGNGTCCSSTDVDDARAVCDHLGIPFYVVNCESKFQAYVIDDFVESYLAGQTPIPCVHCNTHLKFDHLFKKMKELNCDYLATGHYAQIAPSPMTGLPSVYTSEDSWKDQTYFLFTLDPKILPHLLFPVGDWEKPKLREYAEEKSLPVARKKDSTGICFIGKKGYAGFVEERVPKDLIAKGEFRKFPSGEVLGQHEGLHKYTFGQRRGIGLSAENPLYVVKLDPKTSIVWLGEEKDLYSTSLTIDRASLLDPLKEGERLRVKIRFHHAGAMAKVSRNSEKDSYVVEFDEPQRSITPGQAAVFYRDQQLLGGGWIRP